MRITILTDNMAGPNMGAEHGLSYFIEHEGVRIVFDTGQSNLFLTNGAKLGINIESRDLTILSHGHYDHGDGLEHLKGGRLICHPGCFVKRYRVADRKYIGLKMSREELAERFELITSREPYLISDSLLFLGEVSRVTDFESKETTFCFDDGTPDFVVDDSALAVRMEKGLFIITGCGHAGVVNTIEHAKRVAGEERLYGVMGGFHLKQPDRQTMSTIAYLRDSGAEHILPSHCTADPAVRAFEAELDIIRPKTGDIFQF